MFTSIKVRKGYSVQNFPLPKLYHIKQDTKLIVFKCLKQANQRELAAHM